MLCISVAQCVCVSVCVVPTALDQTEKTDADRDENSEVEETEKK